MNDQQFLDYVQECVLTGVRRFPGFELSRLCRLSGQQEMARYWLEAVGAQMVDCEAPLKLALVCNAILLARDLVAEEKHDD